MIRRNRVEAVEASKQPVVMTVSELLADSAVQTGHTPSILIGGDAPIEQSYNREIAIARAEAVLQKVLAEQTSEK